MWLVADIGGTHSRFMMVDRKGRPSVIQDVFSGDVSSLEEAIAMFLAPLGAVHLEGACFALAGPVVADACQLTALPWPRIETQQLCHRFRWKHVWLINDMMAHAMQLAHLNRKYLHVLHGKQADPGHQALLIPGTGLGEAFLCWDGKQYHPVACEGGNCYLAPGRDIEIAFWHFMQRHLGHTVYNTVLGGNGMCWLYDFFLEQGRPADPELISLSKTQLAMGITERGIGMRQGICFDVVQAYITLLIREMTHCALKYASMGGVVIGGAILTKLLPLLRDQRVGEQFALHPTHSWWLQQIPIYWMDTQHSGVHGAAIYLRQHQMNA